MEQYWIIFAIAGLTVLGLGDYVKKMILSKGINKEVFLLSCFLIYIPAFWCFYFFLGTGVFQRAEIQAAVIIGICNFAIPLGMLTAFKYLNMSFALVSIRLISSFILLGIGIYFLGDDLNSYNIGGFILGAIAIFLFSGFQTGSKLQLHPKGIISVIACIFGIVIGTTYFKYILPQIDVFDYMPLQFTITGALIFIYMVIRNKMQYFTKKEFMRGLPYAVISGILFLSYFLYLYPNIYSLGTLSLSYKMLSYSLVVPIILSVVFLGEPINKTRIIAFGLTIISIFLFLV